MLLLQTVQLLLKCYHFVLSQAMNCMGCFICVMSNVITEWQELGNLCNKCPKWLIKQNSSYSDYFNVTSGFTLNSRAPGGPVTVIQFFKINYLLIKNC